MADVTIEHPILNAALWISDGLEHSTLATHDFRSHEFTVMLSSSPFLLGEQP